jgi:hypothetical protein
LFIEKIFSCADLPYREFSADWFAGQVQRGTASRQKQFCISIFPVEFSLALQ